MQSTIAPHRAAPLSRAERQFARTLARAQEPGQIAAAKMVSGAFAAHVGLHHAAMLSAAEGRCIQQAPLGEARYRAIVDAYAGYVAHELTLLAYR